MNTKILPYDKQIILRKYKTGKTMVDIGEEYGVTKVRIHQILSATPNWKKIKAKAIQLRAIERLERLMVYCRQCEKEFQDYTGERKYCSLVCSNKSRIGKRYKKKKRKVNKIIGIG